MLHPDYIVGLVDGEGSFTVYVKPTEMKKEVRRRVRVEPRFYLKLVEKDKEILYKLQQSFGCGNVYFQKDTRENHQDCYRYEVANRSDLQNIIIPFFKKHPLKLQSKKKDFQIFCELMKRIQKGEHLTANGLDRLYRLKQRMH